LPPLLLLARIAWPAREKFVQTLDIACPESL
jgi:hypothetical protein